MGGGPSPSTSGHPFYSLFHIKTYATHVTLIFSHTHKKFFTLFKNKNDGQERRSSVLYTDRD